MKKMASDHQHISAVDGSRRLDPYGFTKGLQGGRDGRHFPLARRGARIGDDRYIRGYHGRILHKMGIGIPL